eukprot:TRINITY_DN5882_c0_g2_i1.p1 TRINITY_DN5882_c0_g2~~TRINITY_DN5882_c0_g2_i1.p1  ORF type:complete len:230 (+),score=106.99 TRINITY_DN5882_c0_g2_i1:172-861(+)
MDVAPVVKYLKAADAQDKNIKFVQAVFKNYIDAVGVDHPFEATRKGFHAAAGDARKILAVCKWVYQFNAMEKEVAKWGQVVSSRQMLKFATIACTAVEQVSSDLGLLQSKWMKDLPVEWFDYIFTVAKCHANIFTFVEDFTQLKAKQEFLASGAGSVQVRDALTQDLFRHRLALFREVADITIYLTWIDNYKRSVSPRLLNICALISSVIGIYEVYNPHSHSAVPSKQA